MTGIRELVEVRSISAAPDHVRLSFLGEASQIDASLPLDASIATLLPRLVALVSSRRPVGGDGDGEAAAATKEAKKDFWVLTRLDGTPLSPNATLRDAGVVNGELLRLTAERALSAPTLYDDVVDAAARLNRAAYVGWNPDAARWMAFIGLQLGALTWAYLLFIGARTASATTLAAMAVVLALTLVGAGALAGRSYGRLDVAAALGWAALPPTAAVVAGVASRWGDWGLAAGCAGLVALVVVFDRVVAAGRWAFLAVGLAAGLGGVTFAVRALGVRPDTVGAASAVLAIVACLLVPALTARFDRFGATTAVAVADGRSEEALFENPFVASDTDSGGETTEAASVGAGSEATPAAETVWARVRTATAIRSAVYLALAVTAAAGAAQALYGQHPPRWSGLTFALLCAVALGLFVHRPVTLAERAALGLPALTLTAYVCVLIQHGPQPMPLVAVSVPLFGAAVVAVVGALRSNRPAPHWAGTLSSYLQYAAAAALLPVALWLLGAYSRLVVG